MCSSRSEQIQFNLTSKLANFGNTNANGSHECTRFMQASMNWNQSLNSCLILFTCIVSDKIEQNRNSSTLIWKVLNDCNRSKQRHYDYHDLHKSLLGGSIHCRRPMNVIVWVSTYSPWPLTDFPWVALNGICPSTNTHTTNTQTVHRRGSFVSSVLLHGSTLLWKFELQASNWGLFCISSEWKCVLSIWNEFKHYSIQPFADYTNTNTQNISFFFSTFNVQQ